MQFQVIAVMLGHRYLTSRHFDSTVSVESEPASREHCEEVAKRLAEGNLFDVVAIVKVGTKLTAFSIRPTEHGSVWVRAGSAIMNRDGSVNVTLDVLPLDGKLHLRAIP